MVIIARVVLIYYRIERNMIWLAQEYAAQNLLIYYRIESGTFQIIYKTPQPLVNLL